MVCQMYIRTWERKYVGMEAIKRERDFLGGGGRRGYKREREKIGGLYEGEEGGVRKKKGGGFYEGGRGY